MAAPRMPTMTGAPARSHRQTRYPPPISARPAAMNNATERAYPMRRFWPAPAGPAHEPARRAGVAVTSLIFTAAVMACVVGATVIAQPDGRVTGALLLAACVALASGFVLADRRGAAPLLPRELIRSRPLRLGTLGCHGRRPARPPTTEIMRPRGTLQAPYCRAAAVFRAGPRSGSPVPSPVRQDAGYGRSDRVAARRGGRSDDGGRTDRG